MGFARIKWDDIMKWYTVLASCKHWLQLSRTCGLTMRLPVSPEIVMPLFWIECWAKKAHFLGQPNFYPRKFRSCMWMDHIDDNWKRPWVHGIAFKQYRFKGPDEMASNFVQIRHLVSISSYTPPSPVSYDCSHWCFSFIRKKSICLWTC